MFGGFGWEAEEELWKCDWRFVVRVFSWRYLAVMRRGMLSSEQLGKEERRGDEDSGDGICLGLRGVGAVECCGLVWSRASAIMVAAL